jgi:hypothetical protein
VQIAYNYGTKIFKGDPVQMTSTGVITAWTAGTGVSQLAGIFWGCEYPSTVRGYTVSAFWPAASDVLSTSIVRAYLIPCDLSSPVWFIAQSDSTGLTQGNVGNNIDVNMGTGSTTTGVSGAFLDTTTIATTNTKPFKIMRLYSEGTGTQFAFGGIDTDRRPARSTRRSSPPTSRRRPVSNPRRS